MEPMKGTDLLDKLKSMISVIYSIVLWMTKLPSAMPTPKALLPSHDHHLRDLGLGSLLSLTAQNLNRCAFIINSYMVPSPSSSSASSSSSSSSSSSLSSPSRIKLLGKTSPSSSSTWSCSTMGDLLGTDSGIYMSSNEETNLIPYMHTSTKRKQNQEGGGIKKEYPPPMAYLKGQMRRMPWVLTREYVDGRLILREERVEHFEYLEAQRENGRLRLNLIPLHHTCSRYSVSDDDEDENVDDEEKPEFVDQEENGNAIDEDVEAENEEDSRDGDDGNKRQNEENEVVGQKDEEGSATILASSIPEPWVEIKNKIEGEIGRCFTFSGKTISTSSSFFHMPIPVKNPVNA